ncbi:MAG: dTMP kinase [Candidatus Nitrosoabyssus spongiisocia]|nr:MAG: dTMP kinase [Nitrosopumilaceae archaeon AB1(1)]
MIIAIEGGDQAGKKTQSELLSDALNQMGKKTQLFSFPDYTTPLGKEIEAYLSGNRNYNHKTIHCLMSANRWECLDSLQKAEQKSIVIINRYTLSNIAYGMANGLKKIWLENLDDELPIPDITIILDISPKKSFERKTMNRDSFEKDESFLNRVSQYYRDLAEKNNFQIINASNDPKIVHQDIMKYVKQQVL